VDDRSGFQNAKHKHCNELITGMFTAGIPFAFFLNAIGCVSTMIQNLDLDFKLKPLLLFLTCHRDFLKAFKKAFQ